MLRGLSQWLLSYRLLPHLSPCSIVTHGKCKKMNAPEAAISFQQGTASLLSAGGRSERQGTKTYKSPSKRSLQPLGGLQQVGQEGGQISSSQHICLHLCLSEEKLNYLTLCMSSCFHAVCSQSDSCNSSPPRSCDSDDCRGVHHQTAVCTHRHLQQHKRLQSL